MTTLSAESAKNLDLLIALAIQSAAEHVGLVKFNYSQRAEAGQDPSEWQDSYADPGGCMGLQQTFFAAFPKAKQGDLSLFFSTHRTAVVACAKLHGVAILGEREEPAR